ncbi:MAG TPA: hypothetical protein VFU43_01730 [Streptosporangiaceae bacterium]|nr:hypothetical protein [Streptosporangiaceae bacterium]
MTDDQRRDFSNLILFCDPHHDFVDDHPSIYNVEMLHRWKDQREAKPEEALARLREVTPAGLRKIVVESLEEHDERLLSAIQRLETSDAQAAALMRNLLDELTEAYSLQRRALNPDLVSEFSSAVSRFSRLAGSIELFDSAVRRYSRMPKRDW